jgi:two-component system, LytTR family, response regulator
MIKCIIIEDEPLATKMLTEYVKQVPFLNLQGTFKDAMLASDYLMQQSVDLIFLDIHLPRLKGMAFLRTLTNPPAIIITTAYHQYAVEGFELNVVDYLLKPFEFERFLTAVNKINQADTQQTGKNIDTTAKDYLFVMIQKKNVKISFADIFYIESQKEYVKITTVRDQYLVKLGTEEIEQMLPQHLFIRIHRSFIVSISKIQSYTAEIIEVNGVQLPVGRAYRDVLNDL